MAERLGTALQKLLQRFESASDLTKTALEFRSNAVFLLFAYVNCGAKAICKTNPYEKVGVLCMDGDKPDIIEYYELTDEMANQKDENGDLAYCYGAIMNYLFRLSKLEEIVNNKIPVHIVQKKIESVCEDGVTRKPEKENGYKFEYLAIDTVRDMLTCLSFEVDREKEFAPIKNKTGVDSVESARELLKQNGVTL